MIPTCDIETSIELPEGPDCGYPHAEDVSDEGFGYFRGCWFIGRSYLSEAKAVVTAEREILDLLDALSPHAEAFEELAGLVETWPASRSEVPERARSSRLMAYIHPDDDDSWSPDEYPLRGLEVGVAGLTYALSTTGFLTAASCRGHYPRGWSDCPVVFFGAHRWRAEQLAELAQVAGCGVGTDRGMLKVYGPSPLNLVGLASDVIRHTKDFRRNPVPRPRRTRPSPSGEQLRFALAID